MALCYLIVSDTHNVSQWEAEEFGSLDPSTQYHFEEETESPFGQNLVDF
jgi:hypothetical protein